MFHRKRLCILVLHLSYLNAISGTQNSPSVIIIGAGAAGIAAASKLLENGFKNVTILEAEGRIGGRIFTTRFDDYLVDLGGQWVHGEIRNVVFELAWPLGLLERGKFENRKHEMFDSSGTLLDPAMTNDIIHFYFSTADKMTEYENSSTAIGEYFENEFNKYFSAHTDLNKNAKGLLHFFNMVQMSSDAADTWWDVSPTSNTEDHVCPGDQLINWKERGYSTILDILMKRYQHSKELPVLENTILNAEVSSINCSQLNGKVTITTTSGGIYSADHVIATFPLGVLKNKYSTLFQPPLPEKKVKTIKGLGFGSDAKIFLSFENVWWSNTTTNHGFDFLWKDEDRTQIENDPERSWLLGLTGFFFVEHKPRLLLGWISGKYSRDMEHLSDKQVLNHSVEVLQRFVGKYYNITKPTRMIRSMWNSNKYFRGTYTFRSLKSQADDVWQDRLAEPIGNEKPVIQFAGEGTHPQYFATVHGAISSGFREADRLIKLYPNLGSDVSTPSSA